MVFTLIPQPVLQMLELKLTGNSPFKVFASLCLINALVDCSFDSANTKVVHKPLPAPAVLLALFIVANTDVLKWVSPKLL